MIPKAVVERYTVAANSLLGGEVVHRVVLWDARSVVVGYP